MEKITSLAHLIALRRQLETEAETNKNVIINVSLGTCSIASGGEAALKAMKAAVAKNNMVDVEFTQSGCMCYCFAEPTVEVRVPGQDPVVFGYVDAAKAEAIVEKFIKNGELLDGVIPVTYLKA